MQKDFWQAVKVACAMATEGPVYIIRSRWSGYFFTFYEAFLVTDEGRRVASGDAVLVRVEHP